MLRVSTQTPERCVLKHKDPRCNVSEDEEVLENSPIELPVDPDTEVPGEGVC